MLPQRHRLRRSAEFAAVLRHGQRAGRGTVVLHLAPSVGSRSAATAGSAVSAQAEAAQVDLSQLVSDPPASRFGLVVGRSVGNSVIRHQVSRRLRGVLAARMDRFPPGSDVVVRARPAAAAARSSELADDLDGALATVLKRMSRPIPAPARR